MKLLFFLLFFCLIGLNLSETNCNKVSDTASGGYYNLGPLIGMEIKTTDTFSTYKSTICTDTYADCGRCGGPAGYCQFAETWADCIGRFSLVVSMQGQQGVELLYDNGDWGNIGRIKLYCDPGVELSEPSYDQNPKNMKANSKYACLAYGSGADSIISPGTAFMITVICLFVLYIIIGVVYNYHFQKRQGVDLFPNIEQWRYLGSLISDGTTYSVQKIKDKIQK